VLREVRGAETSRQIEIITIKLDDSRSGDKHSLSLTRVLPDSACYSIVTSRFP
jgi:hypothetical protein